MPTTDTFSVSALCTQISVTSLIVVHIMHNGQPDGRKCLLFINVIQVKPPLNIKNLCSHAIKQLWKHYVIYAHIDLGHISRVCRSNDIENSTLHFVFLYAKFYTFCTKHFGNHMPEVFTFLPILSFAIKKEGRVLRISFSKLQQFNKLEKILNIIYP